MLLPDILVCPREITGSRVNNTFTLEVCVHTPKLLQKVCTNGGIE